MRYTNTISKVSGFIVSPVREICTLGSNEGGVWVTGSPTQYYTQVQIAPLKHQFEMQIIVLCQNHKLLE